MNRNPNTGGDKMNNPLGNNQASTPGQNQSSGWTPQQPTSMSPAPAQPASSPFESTPIPNITGPANALREQSAPVMMEPASPKSSILLFVFLAILVVGGIIAVAAWMGWLKFDQLFTKKPVKTQDQTSNTTESIINKNDATRKADLANLKTALGSYFNAKQSYPISTSLTKTSDPDTPLKVLVPDYIPSLPLDPLSPNSFYGYKSVDGKTFELTAVLEDKSDPAGQIIGNLFIYLVSDSTTETPSTPAPQSSSSGSQADAPLGSNSVDISPSSTSSETSSSSSSGSASANASASASSN